MSARRVALEALLDITGGGAYANLRLKQARQQTADARDGAFVTAIVYGVLDHLLYIDFVLSHFTKTNPKPAIRGILRIGVCELLFMRTPQSAACNEGVRLTKEIGKGGLAGYVNGVLRAVARAKNEGGLPVIPEEPLAERLSIQYSWPQWLVEDWIARYGGEFTEELLGYEDDTALCVRPQPPMTAGELSEYLTKKNIPFAPGRHLPDCFKLQTGIDVTRDEQFLSGRMTVQGESAMLACHAAGIQPGMKVLDACAAPGGKTAYLYALSGGKAALTAWELHPHRKELLDNTLARLNVPAQTKIQDAARRAPEYDGKFDLVLVDAPCSGFGVAESKPDLRYGKTAQGVAALKQTQARILNTVKEYVAPGGILLYITCTISPMENEEQVRAFLDTNPDFALDDLSPYLPASIPGREAGMLQLFPNRDGVEGFFIARMRKKHGGQP